MAVNAVEDRQVVVVIISPESTCICPEKKKNAAAICMVHAQVRGTVAQSFGLSATTLSQHLSGTFIKRDGHTVFTENWLVGSSISRDCFQCYIQFYLNSAGKNVIKFENK